MTKNLEVFLSSLKYHENPDLLRNGNAVMKGWVLAFASICFFGIHWKRKRQFIRAKSYFNVITLNETFLLLILLYTDSALFSYLLGSQERTVFTMEILRTIFIENLFFKFCVPLYLLLQSQRHLQSLWLDTKPRNLSFWMTEPSLITRPVVSKYQLDHHSQNHHSQNHHSQDQRKVKSETSSPISNNSCNVRGDVRSYDVVVTIHAPNNQVDSLPEVN